VGVGVGVGVDDVPVVIVMVVVVVVGTKVIVIVVAIEAIHRIVTTTATTTITTSTITVMAMAGHYRIFVFLSYLAKNVDLYKMVIVAIVIPPKTTYHIFLPDLNKYLVDIWMNVTRRDVCFFIQKEILVVARALTSEARYYFLQ